MKHTTISIIAAFAIGAIATDSHAGFLTDDGPNSNVNDIITSCRLQENTKECVAEGVKALVPTQLKELQDAYDKGTLDKFKLDFWRCVTPKAVDVIAENFAIYQTAFQTFQEKGNGNSLKENPAYQKFLADNQNITIGCF